MADTFARMRQLIGTTSNWQTNNIVIGDGEIAVERTMNGELYLLKSKVLSKISEVDDGAEITSPASPQATVSVDTSTLELTMGMKPSISVSKVQNCRSLILRCQRSKQYCSAIPL